MEFVNKTSNYLKKQIISKKINGEAKRISELIYSSKLNSHEKVLMIYNFLNDIKNNVDKGLFSL